MVQKGVKIGLQQFKVSKDVALKNQNGSRRSKNALKIAGKRLKEDKNVLELH